MTKPKGGQKIQDVVEYAREQQKTVEEVMVRTMGKTLTEWMESITPKPRNMAPKEPMLEEEEDLGLPDGWMENTTRKPTKERKQRRVKLPIEPMYEKEETELSDEAFNLSKNLLAKTTLLVHPTQTKTCITVDASDVAVGEVLEQWISGAWKPIGFFSKVLNPAATKYSAFDRKLLAIYLSIRHFKYMLDGRQFHVSR